MGLITVMCGFTPVQVAKDDFEMVVRMIEDLPPTVGIEDLDDIVRHLNTNGYKETAGLIAVVAREQVMRECYWVDQRLADAVYAEHGVQL